MKTACDNLPVSRNGAEPAPRWLSHYIIAIVKRFLVFGKQTYTSEAAAIVSKTFRSITHQVMSLFFVVHVFSWWVKERQVLETIAAASLVYNRYPCRVLCPAGWEVGQQQPGTVGQCPLSGSDCPLLFFGPLYIVCGLPERSLPYFIWTMGPLCPSFHKFVLFWAFDFCLPWCFCSSFLMIKLFFFLFIYAIPCCWCFKAGPPLRLF